MTHERENFGVRVQRTRRNAVKMGALLAPAALATAVFSGTKSARAATPAVAVPRVSCFLKGTRIRTAEGQPKVEELAIGDRLPTMFGGLRRVQWIGRYTINKTDPSKPWVRDAQPVRIARSALAPNVPEADLYVTAKHALFVDGVLAPAEMLINGTTIKRFEARGCDKLEFFHIKLESHDVIYAEGAPVETLLQVDESAVNFVEFYRRYGTPAKDEVRCAPYVDCGGRLGELKSRIRSAMSVWIDCREQADVLRDRLEERGIAVSPQSEPAC